MTQKTQTPRVVHTSDLSEKTAQTLAMHRRAAIHAESTGASKIWITSSSALVRRTAPFTMTACGC